MSPELTGDNSPIPRDALSNVKFPRHGFMLFPSLEAKSHAAMGDPDPDPDDLDDFVIPHAKRKSRTAVSSDFVRQFPRKSSARKGYTPSNTAKNNRWAKSLFLDWLGERNATIRNNGSQKDQTNEMGRLALLSDGSDEELCTWSSRFLMEVRKTTGEDYPSSTLHNLLCALQRVVRERKKRPKIDFFRDPLYAELRNTIDIVCRSLHGRGVGVEKARTSSICYDEEEALWSKGT